MIDTRHSARSLISVIDPATGAAREPISTSSTADLDKILTQAHLAQVAWARVPVADRATALGRLGAQLASRTDELAAVMAGEMGKPIREGRAEVAKSARCCAHFAENAATYLAEEVVDGPGARNWLSYEPLGVVLAIMPWNFPLWQLVRAAVPALAAGNGVVIKPSPISTKCARTLERLAVEAGVPNGLLATVLVADTDAPTRVAELIGDPRIRGVTFTGSNVVGSRIAALAAGAVKRSVLELGGSDPFVVLADADLAAAVDACVKSRFGNAGQSCVAGKRIILAEAIAAEFVSALVDRVRHMWVGDPMSEDTEIGPVARADLLAALERQVDHSVAAGAVLRCGGKRIDRPGWFYQPTVLTEVRPTAPVWSEEVFGPVAAVRVVESPEAAVRAARSSPYALGVSVWSANIESAAAVARQLSSGIVALNRAVESDPRMPFGGSDGSGYGRELGAAGTREFTVLRAWSAGAAS